MEIAVAANGHHLPDSTQAGNWPSTLGRRGAGRFPQPARAPTPTRAPHSCLLWTPQPRGENVLSAMEVTKATPSAPRVLGPSQDPTPGAVRTSSGRAGSSVRGLP